MKLSQKFAELKTRGEKALVLFVTAGDPELESLPEILDALVEGGADIIEIGIPFSDPIADGPVIQASSQRALERGVTPSQVFDCLARRQHNHIPLLAMGYLNPVLRQGYRQYAELLRKTGVLGALISDLSPEEAGQWGEAADQAGVETVFLVSPTSTESRMRAAARCSTGFIYAVSRTGVTGSQASGPENVENLVRAIKGVSDLPVCVGFGISTPAHVGAVCEHADGAIVGSSLVHFLSQNWREGAGREALIAYVRELKSATL